MRKFGRLVSLVVSSISSLCMVGCDKTASVGCVYGPPEAFGLAPEAEPEQAPESEKTAVEAPEGSDVGEPLPEVNDAEPPVAIYGPIDAIEPVPDADPKAEVPGVVLQPETGAENSVADDHELSTDETINDYKKGEAEENGDDGDDDEPYEDKNVNGKKAKLIKPKDGAIRALYGVPKPIYGMRPDVKPVKR